MTHTPEPPAPDSQGRPPADKSIGRRRLLKLLATAPVALAIGSRLVWAEEAAAAETLLAATAPGGATRASATPDCEDADEPTPRMTAGPFYTPNSPLRASLIERGMPGTPMVLTGHVVTLGCKPVPGAMIDFWHADANGDYDNEGYRCRGHQFADANGAFKLESVMPGLYPGRTRHFHVRVQPKGGRILTTQLFFPGERGNQRDGIFRPECLIAMDAASKTPRGRFNFVLDLS